MAWKSGQGRRRSSKNHPSDEEGLPNLEEMFGSPPDLEGIEVLRSMERLEDVSKTRSLLSEMNI